MCSKKLRAIENVVTNKMVLNTGTILIRGVNEGALKRTLEIVKALGPRHALLRFKNVGALGRYDKRAEQSNLLLSEMESLAATAIDMPLSYLSAFNKVKGYREDNSRLFPVTENAKPGQGIWIKLTNWQTDKFGQIDSGSPRRGRITKDFRIAPFFENVLEEKRTFEGAINLT